MLKNQTIKKRVMEAVKTKIDLLQVKLDDGIKLIDEIAERDKEKLADELVANITDKLL